MPSVREDVKGYRASGKTENYDAEPGWLRQGRKEADSRRELGKRTDRKVEKLDARSNLIVQCTVKFDRENRLPLPRFEHKTPILARVCWWHKLCPPSETTINYASSRSTKLAAPEQEPKLLPVRDDVKG